MGYKEQTEGILQQVLDIARRENKLTGFCIGNTRKANTGGLYFSPIRNMAKLVAGSVIVYKVSQAAEIARIVDGKVQYILVDTEKKISPEMYGGEDAGNIERAVREVVSHSTVLLYKGNDVTVDSVDCLLAQLVADFPRGIGAKRVAIIGAGNLGSKLALKLVERGAHVVITRRDREKLETIVRSLNYIKPKETIAQVTGTTDNEEAARNAEILIGTTNGIPVITRSMIDNLSVGALVMDGGKGCLFPDAIRRAEELGLTVLRVDIRAGFEGQVAMLLEMERILKHAVGRREVNGVGIVSGGLLACTGEIVVDNIYEPTTIYGMADGRGDFVRTLSDEQTRKMNLVRRLCESQVGSAQKGLKMRKPWQLSEIWEKESGEEYTKRKLQVHDTEGQWREAFWHELVKMVPDAQSYLEIACKAGMNLEAIHKTNPELDITGVEPNDYALEVAKKRAKGRYKVIKGDVFALPFTMRADLVFTCTVLIHIAPSDLQSALSSLYDASDRYILTMEYYWPVVKEVEYHGLKNALWKQDFGALWLRNFNVKLIETGYLDARDGFDRVTWWLFQK